MTKKSSVVEALVNGQIAAENAGLERLLRHFNLMDELAAIIKPLGIPCDLKNSIVAAHAWSLVGPKLAARNRVFLGPSKTGRPPKAGPRFSEARAKLVEDVRTSVESDGHIITDHEILRTIKERGTHPLFLPDLATLRNSVAKGKSDRKRNEKSGVKK